jgi:hypothetical protein
MLLDRMETTSKRCIDEHRYKFKELLLSPLIICPPFLFSIMPQGVC